MRWAISVGLSDLDLRRTMLGAQWIGVGLTDTESLRPSQTQRTSTVAMGSSMLARSAGLSDTASQRCLSSLAPRRLRQEFTCTTVLLRIRPSNASMGLMRCVAIWGRSPRKSRKAVSGADESTGGECTDLSDTGSASGDEACLGWSTSVAQLRLRLDGDFGDARRGGVPCRDPGPLCP